MALQINLLRFDVRAGSYQRDAAMIVPIETSLREQGLAIATSTRDRSAPARAGASEYFVIGTGERQRIASDPPISRHEGMHDEPETVARGRGRNLFCHAGASRDAVQGCARQVREVPAGFCEARAGNEGRAKPEAHACGGCALQGCQRQIYEVPTGRSCQAGADRAVSRRERTLQEVLSLIGR
ncbi:hypothetical protein U1839_02555 [Sphingomonas sp. RT2P30]|uniref:hypothetical protein n=1 Tax=Parasphingomonas halimpatiens TaxID=3096162 RepID=UPI002FC8CFC9